jgi:hypothetical protein
MLRYQDFSLGINKVPNIGSGLDVSGNIAVAGYIDISGAKISKDAVTGGIKITDGNNNITTGVFNRVKTNILEASNIGVGTDNPLYNLHVLGDARIQGNLTVNGTQTIVDTNVQTTERLEITNNGTGPALVINQQGVQPIVDFQDDGQTVFFIQNNGNVGIGTYQPQARLHIVGDVKATINWTDISGAPPYEIAPGNVVINNDNTQLDPSYILADGQTLNRVDFPELANALGIPSNQPTFTVPDSSYFQINWNETNSNSSTYIRNKPNLYGDASGNVGIGTNITSANLHVQGDMYVTGSVAAGNLGMFRNRIINGDMKIDQRNAGTGVGGLTGSYLTYKVQPSSFYTVDRFAISSPNVGALTARQVQLSNSDIAAVGGGFTHAVSIGMVPNDSLLIYMSFDGNTTDVIGNTTINTFGTMQYITACVTGTNALYLANENRIYAPAPGNSQHYISSSSFVFPSTYTVSLWACSVKKETNNFNNILLYTSITSLTNAVFVGYYGTASEYVLRAGFAGVSATPTFTAQLNTWYHVCMMYVSGTLTLYVNGTLVGSVSGTMAQNGFMISNAGTNPQPFAGFIDDFRVYNRALSATEIAALATSTGYAATVGNLLAQGCIGYLSFNYDNFALGNLGLPVATGTTKYSPVCKVGSGSLDLTDNAAGSAATTALTYTLSASASFSVPISLCGWFNVNGVSNTQSILCIGNDSASANTMSVQMWLTGSTLNFGIYVGSWITIATGNIINPGTWYFIMITAASSSYFNCYINGVLYGTKSIPAGSLGLYSGSGSPTNIRIGAETGTNLANSFKGIIDDVRIYNRVLSTQEVTGIYAASQYASYSLFQQTIEGNNLSDLGWGTSSAQPITASMWMKNNSAASQQFSISTNNTGMLAWINFENNSYADKLGFLTNATLIGSGTYSTSFAKVGTNGYDFTANTAGSTAVTYLTYNLALLALPVFFSYWIYPTVITNYTCALAVGGYKAGHAHDITIGTDGSISSWINSGGTEVNISAAAGTIVINTWTHICIGITPADKHVMYINGRQAAVQSLSSSFHILNVNGSSTALPYSLVLGARTDFAYAYRGYIDDVRIYNRALSAEQVRQIYLNNANSTTSSNYLIPRSIVYNTPVIPPNTWKRVYVTIPGDTSGQWMTNTDAGLTLSLCLGASSLYNVSNSVWNNAPEYMGNNVQLYGSSNTSFLSSVANSVYVTGFQLEKGTIVTPFEFRPLSIELQLCQRYFEVIGGDSTGSIYMGSYATGAGVPAQYSIRHAVQKRTLPTVTALGTWTYSNTMASTPGIAGISIDGFNMGAGANGTGYFNMYNQGGGAKIIVTAEL